MTSLRVGLERIATCLLHRLEGPVNHVQHHEILFRENGSGVGRRLRIRAEGYHSGLGSSGIVLNPIFEAY